MATEPTYPVHLTRLELVAAGCATAAVVDSAPPGSPGEPLITANAKLNAALSGTTKEPVAPVGDEEKQQVGGGGCGRAPDGWYCTRAADHDGPCAAVAIDAFPDEFDRPAHGQVWLDKETGFTVGVLNVSGDGPTVSGFWHRSLDPNDGFAFSLAYFRARFLPLAVDPSCLSQPNQAPDQPKGEGQ